MSSIILTDKNLIEILGLVPHPEGGYYKEDYRSKSEIDGRSISTHIYWLLKGKSFSAFHRIDAEEHWHHYFGETIEIHEINTNGDYKVTKVGKNISTGDSLHYVVPAGSWFGARLEKESDNFALLGCTVAPGFEFSKFELAVRSRLAIEFPRHSKIIEQLTRDS